jgi:Thiamine pyrophosphate enzyme, N-terminal TPP binding domain
VTVLPIEEVACQSAVEGLDGLAAASLKTETKAAIENAEADAEDSDRRRLRCTVEDARDPLPYFDHVAATLQMEATTIARPPAPRPRSAFAGPSRGRCSREEVSMTATAADVLIETLQRWGVEVIFGLPGDGINGIMEALRTRQDRIRFVQVRHEEAAAFMACGYAKFTGRLGVCLATSGPGGIHLLNGLHDAALDGQPVLAITGMTYHDLIGTRTQQDVARDRLFMDVAKFNERIMGPAHVENVTDLACRTALAYHCVAHLTFPVDIQEMQAGAPRSPRNVEHHTSDSLGRGAGLPAEDQLRRAADVLGSVRRHRHHHREPGGVWRRPRSRPRGPGPGDCAGSRGPARTADARESHGQPDGALRGIADPGRAQPREDCPHGAGG